MRHEPVGFITKGRIFEMFGAKHDIEHKNTVWRYPDKNPLPGELL